MKQAYTVMGSIKTGHICILFVVFMAACSCARSDKTELVKWFTLPSDDEMLDASSGFYMHGRKVYCDASDEWRKIGLWKIYHEDYDGLQAVASYHDGQRFGLEWHYYNEDVSAVGVNVNDHPFGFGFILDRQMQVSRLGLFSEYFEQPLFIPNDDVLKVLNDNMEVMLGPLHEFRVNDLERKGVIDGEAMYDLEQ